MRQLCGFIRLGGGIRTGHGPKGVGSLTPIEPRVHAKIPERDQANGQQVRQIQIPTEQRVKEMKQEHGKDDADPANGVEAQKTAKA